MTRRRRPARGMDALFAASRDRRVPFEFVLDEIAELEPYTRPMFGCTAVYVGEKIVFVLRERPTGRDDNGVWIATTREHHASLRAEMPSLRAIGVLGGGGETGWQCVPADVDAFEEDALRACALVRAGDARIGKVPKPRTKRLLDAPPPRGRSAKPRPARRRS